MTKENSILNKFLSISIGSFIAMGIGFISTPITTRLISPTQFGKMTLFLLVIDIVTTIVMIGSDQSFMRFFYEEDVQARAILLRKCLALPIIIFVGLSIVTLANYQMISQLLFSEVSLDLVVLLLIYTLLRIVSTFSSLTIRMQQKGKLFSLVQVLNKLLELIGILFFTKLLGNDFRSIIYAQINFMVIVTIISIIIEYRFWFPKGEKVETLKTTTIERIKYGWPLMITALMTLFFQSTDRIIIKQYSTYSELGLYAAAFKVIAILNMLQINFTTFWTPLSYETFQTDTNNTQFFEKMFEVVAFFALLIGVMVLMFKDIIIFLLGSEYHNSVQIMPFLVLIPVMFTPSEITVSGLNFYKKTYLQVVIAGFVCLINLIGNILLVPKIGATGAAMSTGISYIIWFILRTYFSSRFFKANYAVRNFLICSILLTSYAGYLTFNKNFWVSESFGLLLVIVILIIYRETVGNFLKRVNFLK
ncbi:lipopolysaccharide biosynthesis protein [Latilactobacillus fragifolii]|uniref:lipopolysaccharide biosynthesis protein n=1 Tax=Latilactobacillus fragifolii TaxID=2814244 RepID=UPI001ABB700D|nr:oligosaccharide flippase family protein [Latilactobacillus fragifolii]